MLSYIARRLLLMVFVVFGMSMLTFALTHLVPGDPARLIAGPHATQVAVDTIKRLYGLDQPVPVQYFEYLKGLLQGDLGMSLTSRRPVLDDLKQYAPATFELTGAALVLVVLIGIPLGMLSGLHKGRGLDHASRIIAIIGVALPVFWLGLVLQILVYRYIPFLPLGGRLSVFTPEPTHFTGMYTVDALLAGQWSTFLDASLHLVLPSITLAAGSVAVVSRMMRGSVVESLQADYVRTARAKGLSEKIVLRGHVLRNALIPVTTVLGLQVGFLLAGNVLVEVVFNWPGLGLYAFNGIKNLDYLGVVGVTIVIAIVYVVVNLVVDVAYVFLDPRISYGTKAEA